MSYPEITTALGGFEVEWITEGVEVRSIEEITNNEGIATINVIPNQQENISITAKVSGNGLSESSVTETAKILNMPVKEEETVEEEIVETNAEMELDISTIMMIAIPAAAVGSLIFLKRAEKLDLITEKLPLGERFDISEKVEEIKEKISDIRNR